MALLLRLNTEPAFVPLIKQRGEELLSVALEMKCFIRDDGFELLG